MNLSNDFVWLMWSLAFLLAFALIYLAFPVHRKVMVRAALGTAPLGLTEPLFVPEYWHPPSLFDLAQKPVLTSRVSFSLSASAALSLCSTI